MNFQSAFKHIREFPNAFWVIIVATFINQLGNTAFIFLMIYAVKHLGFSLIKGSTVFIAFGLSMFVASLLGGKMIDRVGPARVMVTVLMANSLILFMIPYFQNFYALIFLCAMWGSFYGLYRPASQTLVSFLSKEGMHKITFSVYRLVINLGMSIGPLMGGYLAAYSFDLIFDINAAANLIACGIIFFGLNKEWFEKVIKKEHTSHWSFDILKKDHNLSLFLLGLIPVSMIFFQHESTLPVYINENLNLPLSFFGWMMTVNTLMIVFFELPLNIITLNWSYRVNFLLGSFLITAGFAAMYFTTTAWHLIALAICWTLGEMVLFPAANSYIADISTVERRGSYMALFNATFNLGIVLGPGSGAWIMQYYGASQLWLACGLLGIIPLIIFNRITAQQNNSN